MTDGCKYFLKLSLLLHMHRVHIHKTTCTAFICSAWFRSIKNSFGKS